MSERDMSERDDEYDEHDVAETVRWIEEIGTAAYAKEMYDVLGPERFAEYVAAAIQVARERGWLDSDEPTKVTK